MSSEPETPARPQTPWGSVPEHVPQRSAQEDELREVARKRIQAKRGWVTGFVSYVVVNSFFVLVWVMTGGGYFWPAWVLGGWGIGVVLSFFAIFGRGPITEADIDAELRRH